MEEVTDNIRKCVLTDQSDSVIKKEINETVKSKRKPKKRNKLSKSTANCCSCQQHDNNHVDGELLQTTTITTIAKENGIIVNGEENGQHETAHQQNNSANQSFIGCNKCCPNDKISDIVNVQLGKISATTSSPDCIHDPISSSDMAIGPVLDDACTSNVNKTILNGNHSTLLDDDESSQQIPNKSIVLSVPEMVAGDYLNTKAVEEQTEANSHELAMESGTSINTEKCKLDDSEEVTTDCETNSTSISCQTSTTTESHLSETENAENATAELLIPKKDIAIEYREYENELQMPDIMRLIQKDLSEPYSIYTYRYFIHNWPKLCFLAMHGDLCVGAIVCKLDIHRQVIKRGYIAMLAVDKEYRKLKIGTNLVQKAIQAMLQYNADEVVLETELTNLPALRLYENLGFVRDKRLFGYYLNGVDALRLKLWFR